MKSFPIAVLICFAAAAAGQQPGLRLADAVNVQAESITLADLLPPGAHEDVRSVAADVALGRAPEPGSSRVFTAEELKASVPPGLMILLPSKVVVLRPGWAIDLDELRTALDRAGIAGKPTATPAEVILPAGITTRTPRAQLEVIAVRRSLAAPALIAEVRCRDRSACGRFAVQIVKPSSKTGPAWERFAGGTKANSVLAALPHNSRDTPFLVQAGVRSQLVTEDGNIRITETVVPVRRAREGEIVAVSHLSSRRMSLAEVVAPGVLRPAHTTAGGWAGGRP